MRARDNPFRTDSVLTVRYRFIDGLDWPALLRRLEELDHRAAIVGPQGAGKTTLQEDLAARLQSQGRTVRWLRFSRDNRRQATTQIRALLSVAQPEDLIFIDGAEQLSILRWRRLLRQTAGCAGVIATLHTPGRLPTLLNCRTTPALLQAIVENLTSADACPQRERLDEQFHRHQGNLRLCLRELYDLWATTEGPPAALRAIHCTSNGVTT